MLNNEEFKNWCILNKLPENTQKVIENIRNSPPSRHVGSTAKNVSGRYPSRKMGVTIQFESHKVELPAIYLMEHDPDVLEFYDQPPSIKLNYRSNQGKPIGFPYTADFFIIKKDSAGWEEWKTEEELIKLSVKSPNRYIKDEQGEWRCPPAEEFAKQYGLYFKVCSSAEIDWTFQRNLQFLDDYLREEDPFVDKEIVDKVCSIIRNNPGINIKTLLGTEGITADDICNLIVNDSIYVDLYAAPLAEPERVMVFANKDIALSYNRITAEPSEAIILPDLIDIEASNEINWDGKIWKIVNLGLDKTSLLHADNNLIELSNDILTKLINEGKISGVKHKIQSNEESLKIVSMTSDDDFKRANYRYDVVTAFLNGNNNIYKNIPLRTVYDWVRKYEIAEQIYGRGYIGLITHNNKKGNHNNKLPQSTKELMNEYIKNGYETIKQKNKSAVYNEFFVKCHEKGIVAPSFKTFVNAINSRPSYEQTLKRKGHRAAYQLESFIWELDFKAPRHGDRPFEIAHIDHTELDIELVSSKTGRNLGRPLLTIMTDAYSRSILALYLTFDPPSYRSCMMVLRECVKRYNRLPNNIVVDGGKEFESLNFETSLANYECIKKVRPGGKPRFGSVCERLFGTTNTQFIYNLKGNTQITKNVRQVTKAVNPKYNAVWTLEKLYIKLCKWAYEVYDNLIHSSLNQSPSEAFKSGIALSGSRQIRYIPYDEYFRISTLPTTLKGTAKVKPGKGIKVRYIYYWSEQFKDPAVENKQVPVRYDPFDVGIAYAYVKKQWVHCRSEYYLQLGNRTEKEVMIASSELMKQKQNHGRDILINAKNIGKFLNSIDRTEGELLLQRMKDSELKQIIADNSQTDNVIRIQDRDNKEDIKESESDDKEKPFNLIIFKEYK